jgi:hypothetical protein
MERIKPYVYDPSQQIRKDLGDAATSVEQGFQNVLNKKKQDYELAKSQLDNIELLKKDLNKFDNEVITKRANELLEKSKSAIKDKGKLDFNTIGQVRAEIESIRDAKRNSALKAKAIEDATASTLKNAANMTDVQGTINQMNSLLRNPDILFSPKPIDTEIMGVYKKGLNMSKIINDKIDDYLESRSGTNEFAYKNDRGDVVTAKYKQIPGLVPTKKGYEIADIEDDTGTKINPLKGIIRQILTPEEMALFTEQAGYANALENDPEKLLEPILMNRLNSSVESKIDIFAEDLARKESLTKATLKRIDLNDKKFELQKEGLRIRKLLASSTIGKNSAQVAALRDKLAKADAEGSRKGVVYDEASGEYLYDETKDTTKKNTDALLEMLGGGTAATQNTNTQTPVQQNKVAAPDKNLVPKQKSNTKVPTTGKKKKPY